MSWVYSVQCSKLLLIVTRFVVFQSSTAGQTRPYLCQVESLEKFQRLTIQSRDLGSNSHCELPSSSNRFRVLKHVHLFEEVHFSTDTFLHEITKVSPISSWFRLPLIWIVPRRGRGRRGRGRTQSVNHDLLISIGIRNPDFILFFFIFAYYYNTQTADREWLQSLMRKTEITVFFVIFQSAKSQGPLQYVKCLLALLFFC